MGSHITASQSASMFSACLYLVSAWCLALAVGRGNSGCQGFGTCPADENCYKNLCLDAREIMKLAFEIGKPCTEDADCPEACMTGLNEPVCGPYLRSLRLPEAQHEPECKKQADCAGQEKMCIVRPKGNECRTPAEYMQDEFAVGLECVTHLDCPEACYTAFDNPTCGPYLSRMGKVNPEWDDNSL